MSDMTIILNLFGAILSIVFFIVLVAIVGKMADNLNRIRMLLEQDVRIAPKQEH